MIVDAGQRDAGGVELGEQRLEVLAELVRIGGRERRSAPNAERVGPRPTGCPWPILQLDQPGNLNALLLGTPAINRRRRKGYNRRRGCRL